MHRRLGGLLIALLLAVGLVSIVVAEDGIRWVGGEAAVNLSESQDVLNRSVLALGPGRVAAIWAGDRTDLGIFLAEKRSENWAAAHITLTGNQETWYPVLAYSGTQAIAVWAQGTSRDLRNTPRAVMQQDTGAIQAQTVITPIFGDINPSLVVGSTGMHLVFAATTDSTQSTQGDLYYTHRYFTQTTWAPPTIVLTHAQVIPPEIPLHTAHVWSPKIDLGSDGTVLHVVWGQEYQYGSAFTATVWYVAGLWGSGDVRWSSPQQISPQDQQHAVRPNVAIGESDKVHITWSKLTPDAQYINYAQLGKPVPVEISGGAIQVNNNMPTWTTSSIAANGENLCVAWHGFYTGTKEEIIMRCSPDSGESWRALINVSDSPNLLSLFPTVKVDGAGQAHVAWVELELVGSTFTNGELYYRTGTSQVTTVFLPLVLRKR